MDEQEFLESMEDVRGRTLDRIHGLLSGTNEEDGSLHSILDSLILLTFGRAFTIGASECVRGKVEFMTEVLGPCGCTDYHMADCPLMTGE